MEKLAYSSEEIIEMIEKDNFFFYHKNENVKLSDPVAYHEKLFYDGRFWLIPTQHLYEYLDVRAIIIVNENNRNIVIGVSSNLYIDIDNEKVGGTLLIYSKNETNLLKVKLKL